MFNINDEEKYHATGVKNASLGVFKCFGLTVLKLGLYQS